MSRIIKAVINVLLKVLVIGLTFLVGLNCVLSKYDIVKGTNINPDIISGIGLILMLGSVVIWKMWGETTKIAVDERIRIRERRRG